MVDATYRSDLRELNELNFARLDAKLEQRFPQLDAKVEYVTAALDSKIERPTAALDAKVAPFIAEFSPFDPSPFGPHPLSPSPQCGEGGRRSSFVPPLPKGEGVRG